MAQIEKQPVWPIVAFNKDAFPNRRRTSPASNHSPCRNKPSSVAYVFKRNIRLSLALWSRAAQLQPLRSKDLCVLEPLIGGAKVPLVSSRFSRGASQQP
jgi:hypothetical protein